MSARVSSEIQDPHFTVALQGFSEFERTALASFFRLAAQRSPAYRQVERVSESHFIIVDADHAASLQAVLAADRMDDTVFIGNRAPDGATSWLRRPIEPTHIVRELDSLVALRRASVPVSLAALAAQAASATPTAPASVRAASPAQPVAAPAPVATPRVVTSRAATVRRPDRVAPLSPTGPDVLIAEDSRIARRFLQLRLERLGYRVHLASDGDEALEQFTQRAFELVFLDVELGNAGSIDGFALCQHLKQHPDLAGGRAPKVIFVTGLSGAMDRVRGQLAGCDAYLTKPLIEAAFMKTLHLLDPSLKKRSLQVASVASVAGATGVAGVAGVA